MILLDTHVLLWWLATPGRLSPTAAREIDAASSLLVSPLSCWEVAVLMRLGRLLLDREPVQWVRDLFALDRVEPAPLTPTAAAAAEALGNQFPGDPVDRMLYATAGERGVVFVTKDKRIHSAARERKDVRVAW